MMISSRCLSAVLNPLAASVCLCLRHCVCVWARRLFVGSGRYAVLRGSKELAVHRGVNLRKDFVAKVMRTCNGGAMCS
jgi:hypothetical protein